MTNTLIYTLCKLQRWLFTLVLIRLRICPCPRLSLQIIDGFRDILLHAETIDILDVVLEYFLPQITESFTGADVVKYLFDNKYVSRQSREQLAEWNIHPRNPDKDVFLFSGAWQGLFSIFPGTKCGSQPVESFHGTWEAILSGLGPSGNSARALHSMQNLYTNDAFGKSWKGSQNKTIFVPHAASPDFLSGHIMRQIGCSNSVEYIQQREAGVANYLVLRVADQVVAAVQHKGTATQGPAECTIDDRLARIGAACLFASGNAELKSLLLDAGILYATTSGTVHVSLSQFRAVFVDIAYVIMNFHEDTWEWHDKHVCTCDTFGIAQQCSHTLLAEGLPEGFADAPAFF